MLVTGKNWARSPLFDLTFIFSALWLAPVFLLIFIFFPKYQTHSFLLAFFLVAGGHLLAPIWTLISNKDLRKIVFAKELNFYWISFGLFFSPLLLLLASAWMYSQQLDIRYVYAPVFFVFSSFFIFNSWHFAMQNFGIIRTYKKIQQFPDVINFDFYLCLSVQFIILTVLWFNFNIRNEFLVLYRLDFAKFLPLQSLVYLFMLYVFLFAISILRAPKNLLIILAYVQFFITHILILINPIYFTMTLYSSAHHLQEFGINSILNSKIRHRFEVYKYVLVLIIVSIAFAYMHKKFEITFPNITAFGGISYEKDFSAY